MKKKYSCAGCSAICCRNLAVEITMPRTRSEIDALKWQLHFDTVKVFIRSRRWHQLVEGACRYLTKDNLCSIYERRPDVCREHNPPDCERHGKFYDVMISDPDELEAYFKRIKLRRKRRAAQKARQAAASRRG